MLSRMWPLGLAAGREGLDPLVLLLLGLFIEAYVGEARLVFRFVKHPVKGIGALVSVLDRKLNRDYRSERDRLLRGALATVLVVAVSAALGLGVAWLTRHHPFGWVVELALIVTLLAQRGLYDRVRRVARALDREGLEAGRREVAHIVGRDVQRLDAHGVARAAVESAAENFCDAVVAPVFWYALLGFPGLLAYKAVNTMDSMVGHTSPKYRSFGMAAARLDDALNFIPARLAGVVFCAAALFAPTANPWAALKVMARDARKHRSPNAGWTEAAVAGALGLALSGPRHYAEHTVGDAWLGDGRARATAADIRRALYLYVVAGLINAGLVAAVLVARLTLAR
jgi:adenosylcobinamide-phosphate synthase